MGESQKNIHDTFVKRWLEDKKQCAEVLSLVLPPRERALLNWKTLKLEKDTFIDPSLAERRSDVIVSVKFRNKKTVHMVFLIEHKSYQEKGSLGRKTFQQFLEYLTSICRRHPMPVLPILIYHGRSKNWRSPLSFQDSLEGLTPSLRRQFGRDILNFRYRLLNIRKLENSRKAKSLTCWPILYILTKIWDVKEMTVKQLFRFAHKLREPWRATILEQALGYLRRCDKIS